MADKKKRKDSSSIIDEFRRVAHIEFSGSREVIIEGCRGIIEYDENVVRLNIGRESVRFTGKNLVLSSMTETTAVIEGSISSMEFVR